MPILPITIRNKNAVYTGSIPYVCSNSDYEVIFTFDSEWDQNTIKTVRFVVGGQYVDRSMTENVCAVPVFEEGTFLQVGVYAGDLQTSTPAVIRMCDSIRSGNSKPADPEPEVYDQLMEKINQLPEALHAAENAAASLKASKEVLTAVEGEGDTQIAAVRAAADTELERMHAAANDRLADFDAVGAVRFDAQTLDAEQQAQARENIGASSTEEYEQLAGEMAEQENTLENLVELEELYSQVLVSVYYPTAKASIALDERVSSSSMNCALIPCKPGDAFVISGKGGNNARLWAFSDADGLILERADVNVTETNKKIVAPSGASYLIINVYYTNFEKYHIAKVVPKKNETTYHLRETPKLFLHERVDNKTGAFTERQNMSRTDFLEISDEGVCVYGVPSSSELNALYDKDKNYIRGFSTSAGDFVWKDGLPENAKYVVFSDFMYNIRKYTVPSRFARTLDDKNKENKNVFVKKTDYYQKAPAICDELPDIYTWESTDYNSIDTVEGLYAKYDALLVQEGVTKNLLGYAAKADGTADETLPIYEYEINRSIESEEYLYRSPLILLSSLIHGNERVLGAGLYNFTASLFDENNPYGKTLLRNFRFKIVPVANPWGYNNNSRYNARGVNINRNFSNNWTSSSENGKAPYSEPETQALQAWIAENTDAMLALDMHAYAVDAGESASRYYIASDCHFHRACWTAFLKGRMYDYYKDTFGYRLDTDHIIERNTIPGLAAELYSVHGVDASILEMPGGSLAAHTRRTTEMLGSYLMILLKHYRI